MNKPKNQKQKKIKSNESKTSSSDVKNDLSVPNRHYFVGADCNEIETCNKEDSKNKSH